MLTELNNLITKNPLKSIALALVIGVLGTKVIQDNPLEEKPIVQYRVVYANTADYGRNCGGENGFFWFTQELEEGIIFDDWKPSGWCSETEKGALSLAEAQIEKRIETAKSKAKIYQAWATKEDSVRFESLEIEQ